MNLFSNVHNSSRVVATSQILEIDGERAVEISLFFGGDLKGRYFADIYSNITIECAGEQYGLYKKFMSSEVIHLRYDNAKIRVYLESVVNQYNNTLNAINYMIRLSNQPKFKLKLGTAQSFREKQADGTDKIVTKDMYAEKIKRLLESEDITVMTESEGVSLENIQINASAKAEELAKVALAINNEAANAFDIPEAVFKSYRCGIHH